MLLTVTKIRMMQKRLVVSLYSGLIIYLAAIFVFGSTGRAAYGDLEKQRIFLEKHVENLRSQGKNLHYMVEALQTDPDRIVKEGRRLLLLREREGIIRIAGYSEKTKPISPGGLIARWKDSGARKNEPFLRAFSLAAAIVIFIMYRPGGNKIRGA